MFEIPCYDTYVVGPYSKGVLLFDDHGSVPGDVWKTLSWDVTAEFIFDMSCFTKIDLAGETLHSMLHTGVYRDYVLHSKNVISHVKYALDSFYSNSPWMQFWLTLLFIHCNKHTDRVTAVNASAIYDNLEDPTTEICICKKIIDDMPRVIENALFKLATMNLSSFTNGDEIHIPLSVGVTRGLIVCRHAHSSA